MPRSRVRRKSKPRSKRDKAREARVRETQATQSPAEAKKLTPAAYRRRRVIGWSLVALGVIVLAQHLVSHAGFFTVISPGWEDIVAGYPLAGVLGLGGALLVSRS